MAISNEHNMNHPRLQEPLPYGVRVSLRAGDPFAKLMGAEWQRTHWFATASERDEALTDMSRKHEYSRATDAPALTFRKVEDLVASRGL